MIRLLPGWNRWVVGIDCKLIIPPVDFDFDFLYTLRIGFYHTTGLYILFNSRLCQEEKRRRRSG